MHLVSASRSMVPRWTGKPPSDERNQLTARPFHSVSLPMKRIRRRVRHETTGVSMIERWIGASTNGPVLGMCSVPSTPRRVQTRVNPATNVRTTA